ncbi:hydrogenase [Thermococcus profundus]|uniref:Hydrogenase n=1 Tax=Thermococcus profundus TaxID=49899 RepID=A0A2Z2MB35_THEPR|nr:AIR synthase family protein [Thermococcus profundus]ASJ02669.1 hydrogenase [Thermococcus profundus]
MGLPPGKLPPEKLEELVFKRLEKSDPRVITGPGQGIDAAAIDFGEKIVVASTDPITGAVEDIGFYAVHVNANDVATFGARPRWFLVTILLPENGDEALLSGLMGDIVETARNIGVSVVGGHTEVTPGLNRPIVIGTMLGEVEKEKLVRSDGARPGDAIVMTKWAGLEGTSIIAREKREELASAFGGDFVERASSLIDYISIVPEATVLRDYANAMHDPTEGGIANGIYEMADAAGLGFRVFPNRVPIRDETLKVCEFYSLNPLALISSGSLLAAVPRDHAKFVVERLLSKGINAAVIGEFLAEKKRVAIVDGEERPFPRPKTDELWKVFGE